MTIEYLPPGIQYLPDERLKRRESDVVCAQCGILGGGTLSTPEAKIVAQSHDSNHPDHAITVTQAQCGFGMW